MKSDNPNATVNIESNGNRLIYCPGCETVHVFDKRWSFNGDEVNPTFKPSLLIHADSDYWKSSGGRRGFRCHSFVTNGRIQFLKDSTHKLAGQTVDLPPFRWHGEVE